MAPRSRAAEQRAWRSRNPDKVREYNRRARFKHAEYYHVYNKANAPRYRELHLIKKYGLTQAVWDALFAAQDYRCKICRTDIPKGRNWHTDHCPHTNIVRGILCCFCNHSIQAGTREDAIRLRRAMQYVENFL